MNTGKLQHAFVNVDPLQAAQRQTRSSHARCARTPCRPLTVSKFHALITGAWPWLCNDNHAKFARFAGCALLNWRAFSLPSLELGREKALRLSNHLQRLPCSLETNCTRVGSIFRNRSSCMISFFYLHPSFWQFQLNSNVPTQIFHYLRYGTSDRNGRS
jgi:hypothetical protein